MNALLDILFYGLIAGALYALVVFGYSLIYSILGFVNFAHGEMLTIGAYLCWAFSHYFSGIPFVLSSLLAVIITGILSFCFGYFLIIPARSRSSSAALIVAIGLSIFIQNLIGLSFDSDAKPFTPINLIATIVILGIEIRLYYLLLLGFTTFLLLFFWFVFFKRTRLGLEVRACSSHPQASFIHGLRRRYVFGVVFFLSGLLAGVAGIAVGIDSNMLIPTMGFSFGIRAFIASVIGGINNFKGAIAGAFLLGMVENLLIYVFIAVPFFKPLLPLASKDILALMLLVVILLWRPTGLFNKALEYRP